MLHGEPQVVAHNTPPTLAHPIGAQPTRLVRGPPMDGASHPSWMQQLVQHMLGLYNTLRRIVKETNSYGGKISPLVR